jgi:hypothetical protein
MAGLLALIVWTGEVMASATRSVMGSKSRATVGEDAGHPGQGATHHDQAADMVLAHQAGGILERHFLGRGDDVVPAQVGN